MAKQRRQLDKSPSAPTSSSDVPREQSSLSSLPGGAIPQAQPETPKRRTTYVEAVALYERGLEALQRHAFGDAAGLFDSVLSQYPEEKELHERVRLYLNICQRQATPKEAAPQTQEER